MKKLIFLCLIMAGIMSAQAKTLVVYYSYTNNVNRIITELTRQIEADLIRVEPAEKDVDYAANNYAIGSALIAAIRANPDDAATYPKIDPVDVNMADYDCVIIGAPLWWGNMAAPLQTFLFHHGKEMAGKKIGLIVSSASSGISGVESDAKRLIPGGDFLSPSLWIRSSQTSNASSLVEQWLREIKYSDISGVADVFSDMEPSYSVYDINGRCLAYNADSMPLLAEGLYIVNRKKVYISR